MSISSSDSDRISQGLRLVSYCPVCDIRSKSMLARTLSTEGETKLMHIKCHKCHNAFLALILVNQVGASSVGLLTDLDYEDVVRFCSHQDVTVNDVIAIHERLSQGNFSLSFQNIVQIPAKSRVIRLKKKTQK